MKALQSRRRRMAGLLLISAVSLAACSSAPEAATDEKSTPAAETGKKEEGPLSKYDPPIQVNAVRGINASYKLNPGEAYDNNVWTKGYEQELGIQLKYKWIVDNTQYEQKIGLNLSSGDLPDLFAVNAKDFNSLAANGAIADLTDAYNKYASPLLKSVIEADPKSFQALHYGGKLMALGQPGNLSENVQMIWIRDDWLQNVGLAAPKTMDDVLKIAEAFSKKDPDKNGKDDTYGLGLTKDLFIGGFSDLMGFANGYHAYPNIWIKDSSGKLVYGNVQPEMKTVLASLQTMYKAGLLDKEFGVKDGAKVSELTTAGKIGMEFGAFWNPGWPLGDNKKADPNAEWRAYPIVSADSQPALGAVSVGVGSYVVANKKFANPEALIKLANYSMEKGYGQSAAAEYNKYMMGDDGRQLFDLAFLSLFPVSKNVDIMHAVSDAIQKKDGSKLRGEDKNTFESAMKWLDQKESGGWVHYNVFGSGADSAMAVIEGYKNKNAMKVNEFYGPPTPTMVDKKATLDKLEAEAFTKIIIGGSLDGFDEFVGKWHKLGGDDMITEVNDWYARNK